MAANAADGNAYVGHYVMTDLDRRTFFKTGTLKLAEVVINRADARARHRAQHWIRPPHALDELDFLTTCTRCGECIDACPHQVIFPLPSRLGATVTHTPALDLINKACHLCADWPCVSACKPAALKFPLENQNAKSGSTLPIPRIAVASIDHETCLPYNGPECGACASSCPIPGALNWRSQKPFIDSELCVGCSLCREACITDPKSIKIKSLYKDAVQADRV